MGLLSECEVLSAVKPYGQLLYYECLAVCQERGYPVELPAEHDPKPSLLPVIPSGVYTASIVYTHIKTDIQRLIYLVLFTACILYLDDLYKRDVESVALFGQSLKLGDKQGDAVLDGLADLLKGAETHFGSTG